MTAKSDQDPDPHGSALVCLPEDGLGSVLKPMWVCKTGMYADGFQNVLMAYCSDILST